MARARTSTISKGPFFIVRFLQGLCSVIVLAVLAFFQWNLWHDGYSTPWEFAILDAVASLTIVNGVVTAGFMCCCGLLPLVMFIIDFILSLCWAISFGTLLRAMGKTITQQCTTNLWGNSTGVAVCHMFKVLVAFTILAWITMLASIFIASSARKSETSHKYAPAHNPANLEQTSTTYEPPMKHHSTSSYTESTYGAPPPAVYNPPENEHALPPAPTQEQWHHTNPNYHD